MLVLDEPNARMEDDVYRDLAVRWTQVLALVRVAAGRDEKMLASIQKAG